MSKKFSDLQDGDPTQSITIAGYQNPTTSVKVVARAHALQALATPSEMRAGAETGKGVSPRIVYNWVSDVISDTRHAWADWNPLTVVSGSGSGQGYGTALITGLRVGSSTTKIAPSALGTPAVGAIYNDAALVYNNGFNDNITQPSLAGDSIQLMFWARSVNGGWILLVRWRFAGNRMYSALGGVTYPVFTSIDSDSDLLVHNARGVAEGEGWRLTAAGALEVPEENVGDSDFTNVPYAVKRQGSVLYAISLGYQDSQNRIYRVGTSTRDYLGSAVAVGQPQYVINSANDFPTAPPENTVILIGTSFGTYTKGERYLRSGTNWVKLIYDLDGATGKIANTNVDSGSATDGFVLTADGSGGTAWETSGDAGSSRHWIMSANGEVPVAARVNDIIENIAESSITASRGTQTDSNGLMEKKTLYRITQIGTNLLRITRMRRNGEMISNQQSIGIDKIAAQSGAGVGTYAQVIPGGAVEFRTLGNNTLNPNNVNVPANNQQANRLLGTNAANTGFIWVEHEALVPNLDHAEGQIDPNQIDPDDAPDNHSLKIAKGFTLTLPQGEMSWTSWTDSEIVSYTTFIPNIRVSGGGSLGAGQYLLIQPHPSDTSGFKPALFSYAELLGSSQSSPLSVTNQAGVTVFQVARNNDTSYYMRKVWSGANPRVRTWRGEVGAFASTLIPNIPAERIDSGTLGADRLPTIPASKLPTIPSSKLPTDITAGASVAPDLNTIWHSPGIYQVRPNTPNSPNHGDQGFLIANVNNQTFITNGLRGGQRKHRQRVIAITGQGTPSALTTESDVTFTRITDMLTNLNSISPAAGTKAYYYWHADARGTGNTAGTDRPVNSPGYGGVTSNTLSSVTRQDRTAFGEFTANYQIVCTGGSYTFNVSDNHVFYRTRSSASDSWPNVWTEVLYHDNASPGSNQVSVTALSALHQYGLNLVRNLDHLPGNSATTHEYYWYFPTADVTNHPNGNTSSESPFLVRYVLVSGSTELRCIYNIGIDSGTGTNTYPRAESVTYTETASSWLDIDTTFDSTNNRLVLPSGTQVDLVRVTETS